MITMFSVMYFKSYHIVIRKKILMVYVRLLSSKILSNLFCHRVIEVTPTSRVIEATPTTLAELAEFEIDIETEKVNFYARISQH